MLFIVDLLLMPYLYPSFCLNALNSKNIYYVLFVALFLDLVIANFLGKINLIFFSLFFVNKKLKNYYFKNIFNFIVFYVVIYPFSLGQFLLSLIFYLLLITILKKHNI